MVGPVPFASRRPLSRSKNHPTPLTTVPEGQLPPSPPLSTEQLNKRMSWWTMISVFPLCFEQGEFVRGQWLVRSLTWWRCPSTKKNARGCSFELPWLCFGAHQQENRKSVRIYLNLNFVSYCPQDSRFRLVFRRMGT